MPIVLIRSNCKLTKIQTRKILGAFECSFAEICNKSFSDVMMIFEEVEIRMDGSNEASLFAEITGLSELPLTLKKKICASLYQTVGVPAQIDSSRIFVNFNTARPEDAWRFIDGAPVHPGFTKSKKGVAAAWKKKD